MSSLSVWLVVRWLSIGYLGRGKNEMLIWVVEIDGLRLFENCFLTVAGLGV